MLSTKLARITEIAKERPNEKFTSLAHLLDEETLKECHDALGRRKAAGVDRVTKDGYEAELEAHIPDLVARLKRKAYRPLPVRRMYIPKPGTDSMRPLGIPAYEDKIVQMGLARILSAVYEADFLECSFGFRPGRGCHDALKLLNQIIEKRKVNYVVDADIKGFFNHVNHEWLMKFIGHRIADPSIHRLILRMLKAGYMEEGIRHESGEGTPQGGVVSPVLANIYLHYVLDLWFDKRVRKACRGEAYMVRYADDYVCCFQYESDAIDFYRELQERLKKFNLEIAAEKSKIIAFGRFASENGKKKGGGKPDTFDFLGFTHYCSTSGSGRFRMKRKTSRKKFKASLLRVKEWLKVHRHKPTNEMIDELKKKLLGYFRYYGVTDNSNSLASFAYEVVMMLFKWLNRRSQRKSFIWEEFQKRLHRWNLPTPRIYVNIYDLKVGTSYVL